ncbi:hypothetical protein Tco_1524357 [Tanacetum coccineum]
MLDKRPNDGVLFKNGSSVYALDLGDSKGNFSGRFCVARNGADYASMQDRLNWACGQGQSNCTAIQKRDLGGTRDFGGTGILTNVDPSRGMRSYTKSSDDDDFLHKQRQTVSLIVGTDPTIRLRHVLFIGSLSGLPMSYGSVFWELSARLDASEP